MPDKMEFSLDMKSGSRKKFPLDVFSHAWQSDSHKLTKTTNGSLHPGLVPIIFSFTLPCALDIIRTFWDGFDVRHSLLDLLCVSFR